MKVITLILTTLLCQSSLQIFNASGDIEFNGGINYQSLLGQRQTEWRRKENDLNARINELESKLAIAEGAIKVLESDKAAFLSDNEILAEQLGKCQLRLSEIDEKQEMINNLSFNLRECENKNGALIVSIDELTVQISNIINENESLKSELDAKDRELSGFEVQIINWELELTNCQSEIDQKNDLLIQLEQSQKDGNELSDALKQLNITIEVNEEKNTRLQVENNELKLVIDSLNADIEKLSVLPSIIISLEQEVDSLRNSNLQLQADTESLNVDLTNLQITCQKEGDNLRAQIDQLSIALQQASDDNDRLSQEMSSLTVIIGDLNGSKAAADELTIVVNELNIQLESSNADNQQLREEINRLNNLLSELDSLKEQNSILSIEINNLNIQITEVNQSINMCQHDNDMLKSMNQKLGNDMRILTGELDLRDFANDGTALLIGASETFDY